MPDRTFYFAGGGTGGHIYPAMAVAEQLIRLQPNTKIHFFCSRRDIDTKILSQTGFEITKLPAQGLSLHPRRIIGFSKSMMESYRIVRDMLVRNPNAAVIGVGGFVAAPVCWAAHRLKTPVALLNVDIIPGRANRLIGRFADEIFVQFEDTRQYFRKRTAKVRVVGCPLRSDFANPKPQKAIEELGLDRNKKILLVTGASSGAQSINDTVCCLLDKLDAFAGTWQLVHLTGRANFEEVQQKYADVKIAHKVIDYYDDMADLLAAADLVIGRSGAVSVAEYAAAGVPSICMPYPHHKDLHQYRNAGKLVEVGAAVIVDDLPDAQDRCEWLWEELQELLKNDDLRSEMAQACKEIANLSAASQIAQALLKTS